MQDCQRMWWKKLSASKEGSRWEKAMSLINQWFGKYLYFRLTLFSFKFIVIVTLAELYNADFSNGVYEFSYSMAISVAIWIVAFIIVLAYYLLKTLTQDADISEMHMREWFTGVKENIWSRSFVLVYVWATVMFGLILMCFKFLFPVSRLLLWVVLQFWYLM